MRLRSTDHFSDPLPIKKHPASYLSFVSLMQEHHHKVW